MSDMKQIVPYAGVGFRS